MADHDTDRDPEQRNADSETAPLVPDGPDAGKVEQPRPRAKRPRRQTARAASARAGRQHGGIIIPLNVAPGGSAGAEPEPEREPEEDADVLGELEQRGFTTDEAIRLVHASARIATSKEAREAEATLRRLRFTRWLVEQGMLNEFTA